MNEKRVLPRHKFFGDEPKLAPIDWEFIEKYYPNYSQCDDIALHSDFEKILSDEEDDGSHAQRILTEWYEGNRKSAFLYDDYQKLTINICAKAIENFMKQQPK